MHSALLSHIAGSDPFISFGPISCLQTFEPKKTERNAKFLVIERLFLICSTKNAMIQSESMIIVGGEKQMDEIRKDNENRYSRIRFDVDGTLHVQNSTSNWIPEITFEEEVRGTTNTVSGIYEGCETLDAKVARLLAKGLQDFLEGHPEEEDALKSDEESEEFIQESGELE